LGCHDALPRFVLREGGFELKADLVESPKEACAYYGDTSVSRGDDTNSVCALARLSDHWSIPRHDAADHWVEALNKKAPDNAGAWFC